MNGQKISDALDEIALDHGALTPEGVVVEAADPDHILHSQFTWDNAAAAHSHRLWQARKLIKSVKIERQGSPTPKYLSVKVGTARRYEEASAVVQDTDKWTAVLTDAAEDIGKLERQISALHSIAQSASREETTRDLRSRLLRLRHRFEDAVATV